MNINTIDCNNSILLIVDTFDGASELKERQEELKIWKEVLIRESVYKSLIWCVVNKNRFSNLYMFSDNGFILHLIFMLLKPINIYLYEEGAATYINKSYSTSYTDFLIKLLHFNFGIKHVIGTYPSLKGIYVYRVDLFKKMKPYVKTPILSFQKSFDLHLKSNKYIDQFLNTKNINYFNSDIYIYMSGWKFNPNYIKHLPNQSKEDPIVLFKPHPHLNLNDIDLLSFDYIFESRIIAEVIIEDLLYKSNKVIVIHENSTSIFNFLQNPNFSHINIGNKLDNLWFNEIIDQL